MDKSNLEGRNMEERNMGDLTGIEGVEGLNLGEVCDLREMEEVAMEEKMIKENEMENREDLTDGNGSGVSINTNTSLLEDGNMEEKMIDWDMAREKCFEVLGLNEEAKKRFVLDDDMIMEMLEKMQWDQFKNNFANKLGVEADTLDGKSLWIIDCYIKDFKTDLKNLYEILKERNELSKLLDDLHCCELKIIKNYERFKKLEKIENISWGDFDIQNISKKYLKWRDFNLEELLERLKYETGEYIEDYNLGCKIDEEDAFELLERYINS
jgi:hypothetical protein